MQGGSNSHVLSFRPSASTIVLKHGVRRGLLVLRLGDLVHPVLLPSAGSNATSHAASDFRITDPCNAEHLRVNLQVSLATQRSLQIVATMAAFLRRSGRTAFLLKYRSCYSASSRRALIFRLAWSRNARCFEGFKPAWAASVKLRGMLPSRLRWPWHAQDDSPVVLTCLHPPADLSMLHALATVDDWMFAAH